MSKLTAALNAQVSRRGMAWGLAAYVLASLGAVAALHFAWDFLGAVPDRLPPWFVLLPLCFPVLPMLLRQSRASLLCAVAQPALVLTAGLTLHTRGEVSAIFVLLLAWCGLLPCLIVLARALVLPAVLLAAAAVVGTLPYDLFLSYRWYVVHRETSRIADYVETQRHEAGQYPEDLNAYEARSEWALAYIRYGHRSWGPEPRVALAYHVRSRGNVHEYRFSDRTWFFYPD